MIIGIILGLGAATFQSFSYLMSRHFIHRHGTPLRLLIAAHLIMGVMALLLLPFAYAPTVMEPLTYLSPLIQCSGFFLLGQTAFFMALKNVESSRLSPLLGIKIIIIAVISWLLYDKSFTWWQSIAIIVCFIGAMMTNWTGGTIPIPAMFWIIAACTFYSLSDINIKILVDIFNRHQSLASSSMLAASLNYIICGIVALIFFIGHNNKQRWQDIPRSLPFAVCWFAGMLFLFGCFGAIGPIFGNIIQSSRGIISIIIGFFIARAGHHHLETTTSGNLIVRRIIAAVLMLISFILFNL